MNIEILEKAGIDYYKGIERFLGDTALYETVLDIFLEDSTFSQAEAAYNNKDFKALFECVHSLKGMSGNIDITELYKVSSKLTELLRKCEQPNEDEAARLFGEMKAAYQRAKEGIIAAKQ